MKNRVQILAACLLTIAAAEAGDRLNVKTGQWETTVTTTVSGNVIPKSVLDQMPPAQRAKVEQALAARAAAKPVPKTLQTCVTDEDLQKGLSGVEPDADCKRTVIAQTATHQEMTLDCTRDGVSSKGRMTVDALSDQSMKGRMEMLLEDGKVIAEFTGKWIGTSCPASADQ